MEARTIPESNTVLHPEWKPTLDSYSTQVAVHFGNEKELICFVKFLWDEASPLYGVPRDYADGQTLIIPQEAATIARERGFVFDVQPVVSSEQAIKELAQKTHARIASVRSTLHNEA